MAFFLKTESATPPPLRSESYAGQETHTRRSSCRSKNAYRLLQVENPGLRFYSANLSRWISRDPIEERGGWNQYVICRNSCVDLVDLIGLAIPKEDCSTDIYFGHFKDSWNPTGNEQYGKLQKVAYGVCWGDTVNVPSIIPQNNMIPGIPSMPGYVPVSNTLDYSNLSDDQIKEMAHYYSQFFCAGLKQMAACCSAKAPTGKKKKNGKPVMQNCCSQCWLRIYYDKDETPGKKALLIGNLTLLKERMPKIPGLAEEIKNSCSGLPDKLKSTWNDGIPQIGISDGNPNNFSNPKTYKMQCTDKQ